jgi:flagella basal body P-ring formation protein FlgA
MQLLRTAAILFLAGLATAHADDFWHASHTLMPGGIVRQEDVMAKPMLRPYPGALPSSAAIVGLEVKRYVSANRPVLERDVGAVSAVKANMPVTVMWRGGGLALDMEGRALETGAVGDEIRVLNPGTSRTIRGTVVGDGMVQVRSEP